MFQSEQEQNATWMVMSTDSNMYLRLSQVHEPLLSPPLGRAPSTFSSCLKNTVRVITNQKSIEDFCMASF